MEIINTILQLFIHLDKNLLYFVTTYGYLTYPFLFLIVFIETGIVIFPFLPGDSLIFASAALAAKGALNIYLLFVLFFSAAVIGDSLNYFIGKFAGKQIIQRNWIKHEYLERTKEFFEKHGGKAILLARFVPIIRTIAPFIAGVGRMNYTQFIFYNILGGFIWVTSFLTIGFFFGGIPWVEKNFSLTILIIIFLSITPLIYEYIKNRFSWNLHLSLQMFLP